MRSFCEHVELVESLKKEFQDLSKEYTRKGWTIEQGRKHDKWIPPHGVHFVLAPKTPSDPRAIKNHQALLNRYETEEGAREALRLTLRR